MKQRIDYWSIASLLSAQDAHARDAFVTKYLARFKLKSAEEAKEARVTIETLQNKLAPYYQEEISLYGFRAMQEKYKLFQGKGIIADMEAAYPRAFKFAKFIGSTENHSVREYTTNAYKILVYSGGDLARVVNTFLAQFQHATLPLREAFAEFMLPSQGGDRIALAFWRKCFQSEQWQKAIRIFEHAPEIEKLKAWQDAQVEEGFKLVQIDEASHSAPKDLQEAIKLKIQVEYPRAQENMELAYQFDMHDMPPEQFDRALNILSGKGKIRIKSRDSQEEGSFAHQTVPDISVAIEIDGYEYRLRTLSKNDLRGFIFGKLVGNCMSIDNQAGAQYFLNTLMLSDHEFYVMHRSPLKKLTQLQRDAYRDAPIEGVGYFWITEAGNLVIDSWWNHHLQHDPVATELLISWTNQVLNGNFGIDRIVIGIGPHSKTPPLWLNQVPIANLEHMNIGPRVNLESAKQALIGISQALKDEQKKLHDAYPEFDTGLVYSVKHAKFVKERLAEDPYPFLIRPELLSYPVLTLCQIGQISFDDIINLDKVRFDVLCTVLSDISFRDYPELLKTLWSKFNQHDDRYEAIAVLAPNLRSLCRFDPRGLYPILEQVLQYDDKKIEIVSRVRLDRLMSVCNHKTELFSQVLHKLIECDDVPKIQALVSESMVRIFKDQPGPFMQLCETMSQQDLSEAHFRLLTSYNLFWVFAGRANLCIQLCLKLSQLKLSEKKVEALASDNLSRIFEGQAERFMELCERLSKQDLSEAQMKILKPNGRHWAFQNQAERFMELCDELEKPSNPGQDEALFQYQFSEEERVALGDGDEYQE